MTEAAQLCSSKLVRHHAHYTIASLPGSPDRLGPSHAWLFASARPLLRAMRVFAVPIEVVRPYVRAMGGLGCRGRTFRGPRLNAFALGHYPTCAKSGILVSIVHDARGAAQMATLFFVDMTVRYNAAFLYLNTRGAVAERWGHREEFPKHSIDDSRVTLMSVKRDRMAQCGLKQSGIVLSGQELPLAQDIAKTGADFIEDCLKALQPTVVTRASIVLKFFIPSTSFDAAYSELRDSLLTQRSQIQPYRDMHFSDLAVTLAHTDGVYKVDTVFGPMKRKELLRHLLGEDEVPDTYPEALTYVERRVEVVNPGANMSTRKHSRAEVVRDSVRQLYSRFVPDCESDISDYVSRLFSRDTKDTSR